MPDFNGYINELDFTELRNFFIENGILRKYKKKDFFCLQGGSSVNIGYIESGIFRYIRTDNQGNDHIVGYSFTKDFVCDYFSVIKHKASWTSVQAATDCTIYLMTKKKLDEYWETNMNTQRFGRLVAEEIFIEMYQRILSAYCNTPEQNYITLLKHCPDLPQHISLKEIASLIGVTPETISHIRKKLLLDK